MKQITFQLEIDEENNDTYLLANFDPQSFDSAEELAVLFYLTSEMAGDAIGEAIIRMKEVPENQALLSQVQTKFNQLLEIADMERPVVHATEVFS